MQRGLRLRQHDLAGGRRAAVQGVPQAAVGGVQLAQDLPSHIRARTSTAAAFLLGQKYFCSVSACSHFSIVWLDTLTLWWRCAGPGGAQGALQELQVPVRQRRVPARGVLAAARRQAADGAGAHRGPLARGVRLVVVASQEPGGQRGPAGAGADAGTLVVRRRRRRRRVVHHDVHPRAVGRRPRR